MKVFIDLGAYDGDTIKKALKEFRDFDMFLGFEPMPELFEKAKSFFSSNKKVFMKKEAAGIINKEKVKLYTNIAHKNKKTFVGKGSTLFSNKTSGQIDESKFVLVDVVDFAEYLKDNFKKEDFIVLKIDIEGGEYDLLDHLIKTDMIKYIDKIYCEWHYHKMAGDSINKERHKKLIKRLNNLGFNLTGNRKKDEYDKG
jgi:FkbM family methyltransferase